MEVKLSNNSNNALQRYRSKYKAEEFEPGRKKILNALLHIFSLNWEKIIRKVNWDATHYPYHEVELGSRAKRNLNTLLEHLNRYRTENEKEEVSADQAVNCIIDYAGERFNDPEFREGIIEFLVADAKDQDQLLLVEIPNPVYKKLEAAAKKKDKPPELFMRDLLNKHVPDLGGKQLADLGAPTKAEKIANTDFKITAFKVDVEVKSKLMQELRPFAPSVVVKVIEALADAKDAKAG